jgi:xanthine dehydrogenase accessory factor
MDEALFACLAQWLAAEPVVLATVTGTRGATPRKAGSRMLVSARRCAWSIGGGLAEARVIAAARELLQSESASTPMHIDLGGGSGAAGICGGHMQLTLRRWHGEDDLALAREISARLSAGNPVLLPALATSDGHGVAPSTDISTGPVSSTTANTATDASTRGTNGLTDSPHWLRPNPRLLIVGAGHCGLALHQLARPLDFDIWVFDSRRECADSAAFDGATVLSGDYAVLDQGLDTGRDVHAVLLNRDFHADIATLDVLCRRPARFLGMMGSRRRIREVFEALPQHAAALQRLQAPVGLEIHAETPHEIAVSILAQLIQVRRSV